MSISNRKIRLGMIGGGSGAFIGAVHRIAGRMDGQAEWVAGAFSSDPQKSKKTGEELYLDPSRVYATYSDMIQSESNLPDSERIDAIAIVTPNHLHAAPAIEALERGFHVMVDKPMAFSVEEAIQMQKAVEKSGCILGVTHTYSGYPMIKEMKLRISRGELGDIRKIFVEYPQGWLTLPLEMEGQKQASWRTDPSKSGAGGAVGDIGTHAAHLAEYVTGLKILELSAQLKSHIVGRLLDDDSAALLRFEKGVTGSLIATQVAAGEENTMKLRVYGDLGGLEWSHGDPNTLLWKPLDQPMQVLRASNGYLSKAVSSLGRTPPGHPEGFLEAFANLYMAFFNAIRAHEKGIGSVPDLPNVLDGVRGMKFIDAMVRSSASEGKWTLIA